MRQGQFKEETGAPALRLIGDVSAVKPGQRETVRSNVTSEAVLLNFLKVSSVAEPLQYIMHSAHTARAWLPLFYYVAASKLPVDAVVATLLAERPTYKQRRDTAVARLNGSGPSALNRAIGKVQVALEAVLNGELSVPLHIGEAALVAQAIQAIPPDADVHFDWLKNILLAAYDLTSDATDQHRSARSLVYRAACRLDELEFASSIDR